jgi:hypothetical protein
MEQNTQKTRYELTNGNPIEDIVRECNEGIVDGKYVSDKVHKNKADISHKFYFGTKVVKYIFGGK